MQVARTRLILIAVGAALIAVGLLVYSAHSVVRSSVATSSPSSMPLPPRILGGYRLEAIVTGEKAVEMVSRIHWEPIRVDDAVIARYGSDTGFIVWVARVHDACRLVHMMAEKMRKYADMLPYTAPTNITHGGITFYVSIDKRNGSRHIFWCEDGYVIWLQAIGVTDQQLIDAIVSLVSTYWPAQQSR